MFKATLINWLCCVLLKTIKITKMDQEGEVSLPALKPLKPRVLDIEINSQASERGETMEEDISELRNGLRD